MSNGGSAAIVCRGLSKSYPTPEGDLPVLVDLDFEIKRGDIVAVTGESGAGKSTLLHLLGGLDRATRGEVVVDGVALNGIADDALARFRNLQIGFVFQFHYLLPDFTALENAMMPRLMVGISMDEAKADARVLLDAVGMGHRLEHRPNELSGGEQQRVAVARALVNSPAVVLADEPSGNLDHRHSRQLHDLIWRLARERSATFVIATHDYELARRADRQFALSDGGIRELSEVGRASYHTEASVSGAMRNDETNSDE